MRWFITSCLSWIYPVSTSTVFIFELLILNQMFTQPTIKSAFHFCFLFLSKIENSSLIFHLYKQYLLNYLKSHCGLLFYSRSTAVFFISDAPRFRITSQSIQLQNYVPTDNYNGCVCAWGCVWRGKLGWGGAWGEGKDLTKWLIFKARTGCSRNTNYLSGSGRLAPL